MDTLCIHHDADGLSDDEAKLWLNGVIPPIYLSNGEKPSINPTRLALEQTLTRLDKAEQPTLTYSSGLAAATSVCLTLLKKDDHAIIVNDAYSGTTSLFQYLTRIHFVLSMQYSFCSRACLNRWSIQSSFLNLSSSPSIITEHLLSNTRLVWLESPSNPSLRLVDISTISSLVHSHNPSIIVIVDNTFASPLYQSPLTLGADICLASLTKFINGHTDVIGGSLSMNRKDLYEKFLSSRSLFDMNLSPFDCYLVRRGLNTLPLRMKQHIQNATYVAQFLEKHSAIEQVFYPALPSHPQHQIYLKQGGASGMCSYILAKNADVRKFLASLKLCTVAVSLGGCETLIESPALMTHRSTLYGIDVSQDMSNNLIRMSVGLENIRDIIKDLDRALNQSINRENHQIDDSIDWDLIEQARYVACRSNTVASVIRTKTGLIYSGIQIELSKGRTIACPEISAISAMVNDGHKDFETIVTLKEFNNEKNRFEIISPCEKCKELIEDLNPDAYIIQGTIDKHYRMPLKSSVGTDTEE